MEKCLVCNKNKLFPICNKCKKNPFKVEKCRQIFAENENFLTLKNLYNNSFNEIKNLNTASFWDKRLKKIAYLNEQDGMTQDRVKTAAKFLPSNATRILDIGAGYGFIEELILKRKNVDIYANDISKNAIYNLQRRFPGNYKVESIYSMHYAYNFFDAIFALEVLEHIPPKKILKVLEKIRLFLKKNGFFILSVPMNEKLEYMIHNPNGHVRDYTVKLILAELKLSGFKVLEYKIFYAFKDFYYFKKMLSKFLLKNYWQANNIVIKAQKV